MPGVAARGRGRRTISEINMVPFIDVMLVLLIIFMVTAPLITPSLIELPSVKRASATPPKVLQVIVRKDESLELKDEGNSRSASLKAIVEAAKKAQDDGAPEGTAIVISADKSVRYETVVKVMNELQKADIKRVGLSVQLEK